jgi:hypothetical protein
MEKQDKKQVVRVCYHCGREGLQNVLFTHKEVFYDSDDIEQQWMSEHFFWDLLSCPVCKKVSLVQQYYFSEETDEKGQPIVDEKTVYPATTLSKRNVPKSIIAAFETARRAVDSVLQLIAFRRTLELICKDKDAEKTHRNKHPKDKRKIIPLADLLKVLEQENILPKTLSSSSWVVRELGNDAAHDESEVPEYHMKEIASIVETIIHYFYELPAKIKRLKDEYLPEKEMPT